MSANTEYDPIFCEECNEAVRLVRHEQTNQLAVQCACDDSVSVRVAELLPEGWSADE